MLQRLAYKFMPMQATCSMNRKQEGINKFFPIIFSTAQVFNVCVRQYTIVCLHGSLTRAWVRILIEVFRFAMERVICFHIEES